jgi:hypothetical protein
MKIQDLAKNPGNPRTITETKKKMLLKALRRFGDLSGIVYNRKTAHLVGGHQRSDIFDPATPVVITKSYSKPTKTGTVAEGYIEAKGERFTYREVFWDEPTEKAATIAANKGAGEWDLGKLSEWVKELASFDTNFELDLTMFDEQELAIFLRDIDKINAGDESAEWAQMGDVDFRKGNKYITLVCHFKSEKDRETFVKKTGINIFKKLKAAWVSTEC